jgi:hypothetical protein
VLPASAQETVVELPRPAEAAPARVPGQLAVAMGLPRQAVAEAARSAPARPVVATVRAVASRRLVPALARVPGLREWALVLAAAAEAVASQRPVVAPARRVPPVGGQQAGTRQVLPRQLAQALELAAAWMQPSAR